MGEIKSARELLDGFVMKAAPLSRWTTIGFHGRFGMKRVGCSNDGFERCETEQEFKGGERRKRNERHRAELSVGIPVR